MQKPLLPRPLALAPLKPAAAPVAPAKPIPDPKPAAAGGLRRLAAAQRVLVVPLDEVEGEQPVATKAEIDEAARAALRAVCERHPLVAGIVKAFPGVSVVTVTEVREQDLPEGEEGAA
ncbi:hypothetical protein [Salinarimonas rosea]|uniref:hypothetical protein n=1 Tax=Salinarimonas rosea TaxID=552063 RepID=UPI00041A4F0E|nr:hypothetical protein [Salinarimonas rosea]